MAPSGCLSLTSLQDPSSPGRAGVQRGCARHKALSAGGHVGGGGGDEEKPAFSLLAPAKITSEVRLPLPVSPHLLDWKAAVVRREKDSSR